MNREEEQIAKAVVRLNAKLLGTVLGLILGLLLFLATIILVLKGGHPVGPHLALLGQYFPGYKVTVGGSLLGFCYAFITGFVIGSIVGAIYNKLVSL